tara:strand:+ start:229 stop:387 length:159 start_codon:yes stop_codon:yes gene_type:complete
MTDTFNITVKCETEEERDSLLESLDLGKVKNPQVFYSENDGRHFDDEERQII